MQETTNYGLKKPQVGVDNFDIEVFNVNADTVDSELLRVDNNAMTALNNIMSQSAQINIINEFLNKIKFPVQIKYVSELPLTGDDDTLYLLITNSDTENTMYKLYIYRGEEFVDVGINDVDNTLSDTSENPVQNKVVSAIAAKVQNGVSFAEIQNLTDTQKAQARENIDAIDITTFSNVTTAISAQKANNNDVANALTNTATGTAIGINDMSPIDHKIKITGTPNTTVDVYGGLNILKPIFNIPTQTKSGITVSRNGNDYSFNISGTATADTALTGEYNTGANRQIFKAGKYYVNSHDDYSIRFNFNPVNTSSVVQKQMNSGVNSFTLSEDMYLAQIIIIVLNGTTIDTTYYPQISAIKPNGYEPYIVPKSITLDSNGQGVANSISPTMTMLSDNEIKVEYNRDLIKTINDLQNAIISLGGEI